MDGNNEKLQDLCKLVVLIKDVILQPLQCLEGGMPLELSNVVNMLKSYALMFSFALEMF
jgi:hypothetical protein